MLCAPHNNRHTHMQIRYPPHTHITNKKKLSVVRLSFLQDREMPFLFLFSLLSSFGGIFTIIIWISLVLGAHEAASFCDLLAFVMVVMVKQYYPLAKGSLTVLFSSDSAGCRVGKENKSLSNKQVLLKFLCSNSFIRHADCHKTKSIISKKILKQKQVQ